MATIDQISTSNTFGQWVTGTQAVISKLNNLTDGGNTNIFYANTSLTVSGNISVTGFATSNVTTFIGPANTEIYTNIENARNLANAASADGLAFAIALG